MEDQHHLDLLKQGVDDWNTWRQTHPEIRPDLRGTHLFWAHLREAHLREAVLAEAHLKEADLSGAVLFWADLRWANLSEAVLNLADLSGARVWETLFVNVDLSAVKGLDTVQHDGPSSIGIDTLYRSKGSIPDIFLREAGVPKTMRDYIRSFVGQPIDYYTCFISYSRGSELIPIKQAVRVTGDYPQVVEASCWRCRIRSVRER